MYLKQMTDIRTGAHCVKSITQPEEILCHKGKSVVTAALNYQRMSTNIFLHTKYSFLFHGFFSQNTE